VAPSAMAIHREIEYMKKKYFYEIFIEHVLKINTLKLVQQKNARRDRRARAVAKLK
jgi:hypothetical protein